MHLPKTPISLFVVLIPLFLSSCATQVAKSNQIEEIRFGSGGGFTGKVTTYTLDRHGRILLEDQIIKKLSRKATRQLFSDASEIDTKQQTPSNTYNFIHIRGNNIDHYYVWTIGNKIDPELQQLYTNLTQSIR